MITLIPKIPSLTHAYELRPISLCNFTCNVIIKVLVNKLRVYLTDINSSFQSAFVEDRLIQDNIMVAHKGYHHLKTKMSPNKVQCVPKVDMQKAYNRVEWDFLLTSLEKRRFGA